MAFSSGSAKSALLGIMDSVYGPAEGDGIEKREQLADILCEWLADTVLPSLAVTVTILPGSIATTGSAAAQTGPAAPLDVTGVVE